MDEQPRANWVLRDELRPISSEAWQLGRRAWEESQAHYEQAKIHSRHNHLLTWLSVLLAALSGVTALADLHDVIVASIAFAAAVGGGATATFAPGERAGRHRVLGVEFAAIRHAVHHFSNVRLPPMPRGVAEGSLRDLRDRWERASRDAPLASDVARQRAAKLLEKDISEGGLAWDIGPNIGVMTLPGPRSTPLFEEEPGPG